MKYIINEEQYIGLILKKKEDKIINKIHENIDKLKKSLKSENLIKESIKDVVTIYRKKGLLTQGIVNRLNEENVFIENPITL